MKADDSFIIITSTTIQNMTGFLNTGGIDISGNSFLLLQSSDFTGNNGGKSSDLLVENCQGINISLSRFRFLHNKPVMIFKTSLINIVSTEISGIPLIYVSNLPDSIIAFNYIYGLFIQNCVFSHLNSFNSPLYIKSDRTSIDYQFFREFSDFIITNSNFSFCSSQNNGGVFFITPYFNTNITNCIFKSNIALNSGGTMFFSPLRSYLLLNLK